MILGSQGNDRYQTQLEIEIEMFRGYFLSFEELYIESDIQDCWSESV